MKDKGRNVREEKSGKEMIGWVKKIEGKEK